MDFSHCAHRLADLLEENQEELATIEALDSGAVYTLALKTHIGMSVQTFRYFAGWCDKIQVGTNAPHPQERWFVAGLASGSVAAFYFATSGEEQCWIPVLQKSRYTH